MRSATGVRDPLSKTITSRGGRVCAAMESRQANSISPPSMSSTITETSVMPHPVEVGVSVETAQLDASGGCGVDMGITVCGGCRRQYKSASCELDRRACLRLVSKCGTASLGQERNRVAAAHDPAALVEETRDRPLSGKQLAAVVYHVRVFK